MKEFDVVTENTGPAVKSSHWKVWGVIILIYAVIGFLTFLVARRMRGSNDESAGYGITYQELDCLSADLIVSKGILINNLDGKKVGYFSADDDDAGRLSMYDAEGNLTLGLSAGQNDGPDFTMYGRDGEIRIMISLSEDGRAQVSLFNNNQNLVGCILVDELQRGTLLTMDGNGDPSAALFKDADGDSRVALFDKDGEKRLLPTKKQESDAETESK